MTDATVAGLRALTGFTECDARALLAAHSGDADRAAEAFLDGTADAILAQAARDSSGSHGTADAGEQAAAEAGGNGQTEGDTAAAARGVGQVEENVAASEEAAARGIDQVEEKVTASEEAAVSDGPSGRAGVPPSASSTPDAADTAGSASRGGSVYVGTAGFTYTHWRKGVFYPTTVKQADELKYYSGIFPACEINATFHGMQKEETFRKWVSNSRKNFVFTLKARRDITHMRKLQSIEDMWGHFWDRARQGLGTRCGPILFQLPPTFKRDVGRLESLGKLIPPGCQAAVEFRNADWYCPSVFDVMKRYNMAIVENVTPDDSFPHCDEITANFTYIRMHKSVGQGVTNYSAEQLEPIAKRAAQRQRTGVTQYVFFLNDHNGNGPANAKTFMRLVGQHAAALGSSPVLVKGWTKAAVVKKGSRGSLESFFSKAAAKSPVRSTPGGASATGTAKRAPQASARTGSPKRTKGPMDAFLPK